jgi:nicotinate-nucleotide pyrophosphorylase (carboxylating)
MNNNSIIDNIILAALNEDKGKEDITTAAIFSKNEKATGEFIIKASGVVAGLDVAARVFSLVDDTIVFEKLISDGSHVTYGDIAAKLSGSATSLLTAERTALNFSQRMSGIASATNEYVRKLHGTKAKILDTRKTAPGLRLLDKMAVKSGGGENHRIGLYDMFLIKDNHIQVAGSITEAVMRCVRYRDTKYPGYKIEVETSTLDEVREVMSLPVDIVMLDNYTLENMRAAVDIIGDKFKTEASGGVNLDTIRNIALTGVDFISVGAITHSNKALDISLELQMM